MTPAYLDTSVLVRGYFRDEADHRPWNERLFRDETPLVSSRLLGVEMNSAIQAAKRARRLRRTDRLMAQFDADCSAGGPIVLLALTGKQFRLATDLVRRHTLHSLDAIHIAAALTAQEVVTDLVFLTCDERQAAAAAKEGLVVSTRPDGPAG